MPSSGDREAHVEGLLGQAKHVEMAGNSKSLFRIFRQLVKFRPRPLPLLTDGAGKPYDDMRQRAEALRQHFAIPARGELVADAASVPSAGFVPEPTRLTQ